MEHHACLGQAKINTTHFSSLCRSEELVDKSLAFELVVLEWALATASKLLCEEVLAFEQTAQPIIENIAKKVCKLL